LIASSTDHRPEREFTFRFYEPADREQVVALFEKQGLKVHLPLPSEDPACAIGFVAEKDGEIKYAFFLRSTYELHLVADPAEPLQTYAIRRLGALAEGAAMELGVEMKKVKFAYPVDAVAFVPRALSNMVSYMRDNLGFIDEATDQFHMLVKRLGS
jgi:hypothetical protein